MRLLNKISLLIATILFCVGCKHHDLYYAQYDYANIRINIDWSEAGLDKAPNGVTVVAYDSESGEIYKQFAPYSTTDHVNVGLPVGTYNIVLFNNSIEEYDYIDFLERENFESFIANGVPTEPVRALSKDDKDKDVIAHPDVIASSQINDVVVTSDMVKYSLEQPNAYETVVSKEFDTKPQRRVVNVRVYCYTKGVKYAAGAPRTFFKHFSGGFLLGKEQPDQRQVIQEIVLSKIVYDDNTKHDGTIWQEFTSFGKVTQKNATYVVDAEFTLVDGTTFGRIFDVTDQVVVYMDGWIPRIDIEIEIELPAAIAPSDTDGSFDTEVEDWDNIIVGLPM